MRALLIAAILLGLAPAVSANPQGELSEEPRAHFAESSDHAGDDEDCLRMSGNVCS